MSTPLIPTDPKDAALARRNRRTALFVGAVILAMAALSFVMRLQMVPSLFKT